MLSHKDILQTRDMIDKRHLEVRRCYAGVDYALYSEFDSLEDVKNYRAHPLHQEAKSHFHHFLDTRYCANYEV